MKAKSPKPDASIRPDPTDADRKAIEEAKSRKAERPARASLRLEYSETGGMKISNPHADGDGWSAQIYDAFGTQSGAFVDESIARLANVVGRPGESPTEDQMNSALALMGAIAPANELEAAIGEQIIATHLLGMDLMRRARHADAIPKAEAFVNMATKVSRTMATHVETLARLRSGGKQTHEVIYVDARNSQNVIGARIQRGAGGGGGGAENGPEPHRPNALAGPEIAPGVPVWGQDQGRDAMPVAGATREAEMPNPRRPKPRRSKG